VNDQRRNMPRLVDRGEAKVVLRFPERVLALLSSSCGGNANGSGMAVVVVVVGGGRWW
jgi:hypothetical protein